VSKELGVSYNVCKLEPKFIPHRFPGFLNWLPKMVLGVERLFLNNVLSRMGLEEAGSALGLVVQQ